MVPDFLGIGVRRGGSTWLWDLLHSHPDAFVPPHHREVHFFSRDTLYARGMEWYEGFFPESRGGYAAVGEVSPGYLSCEDAPGRIRAVPEIRRLIAILRSPVARTISHYHWRIRIDGYEGGLLDFVRDYPESIRWSTYAADIERYRELFSDAELMVLIFEDVFADVPAARGRIASHLGLDPGRFPPDAGIERVNAGGIPARQGLYRFMHGVAKRMRRRGMHRAIDLLGRGLGLKRLAESGPTRTRAIPMGDRERLLEIFEPDIARLEGVLGRDLEHWRHLGA